MPDAPLGERLWKFVLAVVGGSLALAGGLTIASAPFLLAWQCLFWLKHGEWFPLDVAYLCYLANWFPQVEWLGLQKIIMWFLSWPLSVALFFVGAAAFGGGLTMVVRADKLPLQAHLPSHEAEPMHFPLPLLPVEIEVPDEWWIDAGMAGFTPKGLAYRSTAAATLVRLRDVEPPFRFPEHPLDWRGFDRRRLVRMLSCIARDAEIEPVPVFDLPPIESVSRPFRYGVSDGFHRFYASVAAGFECLPVVLR